MSIKEQSAGREGGKYTSQSESMLHRETDPGCGYGQKRRRLEACKNADI